MKPVHNNNQLKSLRPYFDSKGTKLKDVFRTQLYVAIVVLLKNH